MLEGSSLECRTRPFRLWAQLDYDHLNTRGDPELARCRGQPRPALAGADVSLSPVSVIGVSGGTVTNHDRFADAGRSDVKGDGWQLGAYGAYDPGAFFVKAMGSYSSLGGTARRQIDLAPAGGTVTGKPDVTAWTLGVHAGYRLPISRAGLDHAVPRL